MSHGTLLSLKIEKRAAAAGWTWQHMAEKLSQENISSHHPSRKRKMSSPKIPLAAGQQATQAALTYALHLHFLHLLEEEGTVWQGGGRLGAVRNSE